MVMAHSSKDEAFPPPSISVEQAAAFLRRLAHDSRNALNAIDLQLILVEGESDAVKDQIAEARQTVSEEARRLGDLSNQFHTSAPQWIAYPGSAILEDIRPRLQKRLGAAMGRIVWPKEVDDVDLQIDFELLAGVLVELAGNALRFADANGTVTMTATREENVMAIAFIQPRKAIHGDPKDWGRTPFSAEPRAGYGLGLFAARRMAEAMGMTISFSHDPQNALLTTRLEIPIIAA